MNPVVIFNFLLLSLVIILFSCKEKSTEPDCPGPKPVTGTGTLTDIDGNVYQTLTIGTQVWMIENLKVTHYRNGDDILHITKDETWQILQIGAYCNYNNDTSNVATYGRLYNWFTVDDNRDLAPVGWHVPSDNEWKQLEMYLGMSQSEADEMGYFRGTVGGKMKATGTIEGCDGWWSSPNTGATNSSGLSALPGSLRLYNGGFGGLKNWAYFWSSTESNSRDAWDRQLGYLSTSVSRISEHKEYGFSVRCVKD